MAGLAVGVVHDDVEQRRSCGTRPRRSPPRHREVVLARVERHEPLHRTRALAARRAGRWGARHGHPSASATTYAATSRWQSVPSGKSHSGASPRPRLVDRRAPRPRRGGRARGRWSSRSGGAGRGSRASPAPAARSPPRRRGPRRRRRRSADRRLPLGLAGVTGPRSPDGRSSRDTCAPRGSIGLPQYRHFGRPRSATAAPCRASASICSRRRPEPHAPGFGPLVLGRALDLRLVVVLVLWLVLWLVLLDELLDLEQDQVAVLRVPDRQASRAPERLERRLQAELVARRDPRRSRARRWPGSPGSRSASSSTCCFSTRIVTVRSPSRACRKNVRSPGSPTAPAVIRSTGSRSTDLSSHLPRAPTGRPARRPCRSP